MAAESSMVLSKLYRDFQREREREIEFCCGEIFL